MIWNDEIAEIWIFIVKNIVVERCLEGVLGDGNIAKDANMEKFVFFEYNIS